MKIYWVLVFFLVVAVVSGDDKYTTKYDDIDIEQILNSERLLNNYFECVMERGNCTPDGLELRKNIPDALQTDCSKCSDKQKNGTKKVIKYLAKNKADMFKELSTKYDPEGMYKAKHKDEMAKEGITI